MTWIIVTVTGKKLAGGSEMKKEILEKDVLKVRELVEKVLGLHGEMKLERMGGLTNHTYKVLTEDGRRYAVRIPGDGTEELIDRRDEEISTRLACDLEIDAKMLYFGRDGSKVTEYIPNAITMSPETMRQPEHVRQAAEIFRVLHQCGKNTGVPFEVFDMASGYEKIIRQNQVFLFDDYEEVKSRVMKIKNEIDRKCDTTRVPCHNDPLCENWVVGNGKMYLIDWEYAGMNDGMWDLADVSIEASYSEDEDRLLLQTYLDCSEVSSTCWKQFMANKIYVDYLWTLWAKTRVPYDREAMEAWAAERYARLKENLKAYASV